MVKYLHHSNPADPRIGKNKYIIRFAIITGEPIQGLKLAYSMVPYLNDVMDIFNFIPKVTRNAGWEARRVMSLGHPRFSGAPGRDAVAARVVRTSPEREPLY
jgi:hypothetical protein